MTPGITKRSVGTWSYKAETILADKTQIVANLSGPLSLENIANGKTISVAGTSANKLDTMGFDGDKAIDFLPQLIKSLNRYDKNTASVFDIIDWYINQIHI